MNEVDCLKVLIYMIAIGGIHGFYLLLKSAIVNLGKAYNNFIAGRQARKQRKQLEIIKDQCRKG